MITFWVIVVAMLVLSLWFVIPSLASRHTTEVLENIDSNVSIYKQKLAELETNEEGLDQAQFEQAKKEIELGLLHDTSATETSQTPGIAAQSQKLATIVVGILVPVIAFTFYWMLAPTPFEPLLSYSPSDNTNRQHQQASKNLPPVEEMVAKLEAKLKQSPGDAKGWSLLGRTYFVMGRYDDAAMSYGRAHQLTGDEPELLANYAEALAMTQGGNLKGQAAKLVDKSLAKLPQHPKSLWLGGLAAFQSDKFQLAIERWQSLLNMHPDKSGEGAKVLQQRISEAQQRLGGKTSTTTIAQKPKASTSPSAAKTVLNVQVQLDPKLKAKASPTDTVFVFARAVQGPPMPLAIVRKQVKDLPITVQLDDSMAMMANMTMSSFPQVYIGARISKSGNARPQAGDLQGRSTPVKTGGKHKTVKISINTEVL